MAEADSSKANNDVEVVMGDCNKMEVGEIQNDTPLSSGETNIISSNTENALKECNMQPDAQQNIDGEEIKSNFGKTLPNNCIESLENTVQIENTNNSFNVNKECEEMTSKLCSNTAISSGLTEFEVVSSEPEKVIEEPSNSENDMETVPEKIEESPSTNSELLESEAAQKVKESITASETSDYFSPAESLSLVDNEDSIDGSNFIADDSDLLSLPKDMIEEERKLALQTELEMNALNSQTSKLNASDRRERYKKLMSLLGKSKEYANYMSERLTVEKNAINNEEANDTNNSEKNETEVLQNTTNRTSGRKRKNNRQTGVMPKKRKTEGEPLGYDEKTHYKNQMNLIVSRRQPTILTGAIMRDYQLDGLEWMVALYKSGVNGILADEMGLGKTIQVISLLCHLREKHIYGPHLIIGPLSTLPNWTLEFANFAPQIPVALFHGSEEKRKAVQDKFIEAMVKKNRAQLPVIITSYEMPLRDKKFLSAVKWCYIIVDEGHRLKNYKCMLTRELHRYKTESRLLLTGTPLQNNLTELWSLLNYLIPEIFDNLKMFEDIFDFSDLTDSNKQNQVIQKEKEEQLISKMHEILEPFLLRRAKSDVSISLPGKKEILVFAPLTTEQEDLYKKVIDRSIAFYETEEKKETEVIEGKRNRRECTFNVTYSEDWDIDDNMTRDDLPDLLPVLPKATFKKRMYSSELDVEYVMNIKLLFPDMMLRKIINHPYLVKTPVVPGTREIVINEKLIQRSGKLLVLDALLPRLKADGHKILLFSTFTTMLDLIEDYTIMRDYKYARLDGTRTIDDRLESIKKFNTDPDMFIFLISTRAGGLGINLTAADTVIIYDSDWNPQVDLQAQDRCHRIGQTKPVIVYRLVTAGTIDERIVNTATSKRRLEKLVVKKGKFKQQQASGERISLSELKELMESTDYKQVIYPNGLVLSDEEIDRLLDRSDLIGEDTSENDLLKNKKSEIMKSTLTTSRKSSKNN